MCQERRSAVVVASQLLFVRDQVVDRSVTRLSTVFGAENSSDRLSDKTLTLSDSRRECGLKANSRQSQSGLELMDALSSYQPDPPPASKPTRCGTCATPKCPSGACLSASKCPENSNSDRANSSIWHSRQWNRLRDTQRFRRTASTGLERVLDQAADRFQTQPALLAGLALR